MLAYGNYKDNIDVDNKYNVKDHLITKRAICTINHLNILNKWKIEEKENYDQPLSAAVVGLRNSNVPLHLDADLALRFDYCRFPYFVKKWTDIDDYTKFAWGKPTCYLILGKPGDGAYKLGEAVAEEVNCVHLCPRNLLVDEIEQNSLTGQALDFNMKHHKVCKYNTLLKILKKKIMSPVVRNRGYVLSGFPLVGTSRKMHCFFNKLYSEEAISETKDYVNELVVNLKKKRKEKPRELKGSQLELKLPMEEEFSGEEEHQEEEEEPENEVEEEEEELPVELPQYILDTCSDIITSVRAYCDAKKTVLIRQCNELFKLALKPDIVIYITCPDEDLVIKKKHKYLDYKTSLNTTDPFLESLKESNTRWRPKYSLNGFKALSEEVVNAKYYCRQPFNFRDQAIEQLCTYRTIVLPFLEKKINDVNPKHLIKLDGRTSLPHMMNQVLERLEVLHIVHPVLVPQPLNIEEPPEEIEEFWENVEQTEIIQTSDIKFNYYPSLWYNRCPVELNKRHTVRGKPRYAVKLFKHVYLLSSLDALVTFWKNPRPFLDMNNLEPICRIVVTGTKSSGKSMISECLSWLFNAPIIDYNDLVQKETKKKAEVFSATILSEIIATIEDSRYANWQIAESDRLALLDKWIDQTMTTLKKYIELLKEYEIIKKENTEPDAIFMKKINTVKSQLPTLPFLDDLENCKTVFSSKTVNNYAPQNLANETEKPKIPILGDKDVEKAIEGYIESNDLQKEINLKPEDVMNVLINMLSTIDSTSLEANGTYGKFIIDGFTTDPDYWDLLVSAKLLPDNTIAIIENREMNPDLIEYYTNIEHKVKNYQESFLAADDPLIKLKQRVKTVSEPNSLHIQMIVHDIIHSAIYSIPVEEESQKDDTELIVQFNDAVDKFREGWDSVKLKLEERFKSFIEVEIEEKTDVAIVEETLLKLRRSYCMPCGPSENDEDEDLEEDEEYVPKDMLKYNDSSFLCETKTYCPVAYYDYGVLWEGKKEFTINYNNKMHYFCKEQCLEKFKKDPSTYESYGCPFKKIPPLRICVIGAIGSGKTSISKLIAKELGLIHIDFAEIVNEYLMPRHFKKVGRQYENIFTDVPLDEEAVVEFQMGEDDENLAADIMSNETELRRLLYNYFERGIPVISVLMQKVLKKIWFDDPFVTTGFVLDGYPKLSSDIDDMEATFCIPNLILSLDSNSEMSLERLAVTMLKTWKSQQVEAKNIARKKFDSRKKEWFDDVAKNVIAKVVFDEMISDAIKAVEPPEAIKEDQSVTIAADDIGQKDDDKLITYFDEFVESHPEPIDEHEWENYAEARERIEARIEAIFEGEDENIQSLKDRAMEQKIKILSVDATKPLLKVQKLALSKLSRVRNVCESFFEQTFIINMDIAKELTRTGYCFYSKFRQMCPVHIYENSDAIFDPFKTAKRKGKVFPVVHRNNIYYIRGDDSIKKFRTNPLKYINSDNMLSYHSFPMCLGIIGGPKSGKSSLAAKLVDRYELICVSKGTAIRNILENMHWTTLASKMKKILETGGCIDNELIVQAVQTALIDYRTILYGFVLDGFPDSASDAKELAMVGLYPLVMFDLSSDNKIKLLENSQNEIYFDILKTLPPYSKSYIKFRLSKWNNQRHSVRDFINDDYQNLKILNSNESKWQCLQEAADYIKSITPKLHYFVTNMDTNIVPTEAMCISREIFEKRMSKFKNLCPVCFRQNIFKHNDFPVDRKGIVLYNDLFYWICSEHMKCVLDKPQLYLQSQRVNIPELPVQVKNVDYVMVYANGICIVTYAENLPSQIFKSGSNKYAANFKGKIYLFCDAKCLTKFMLKPYLYHDINVFKNAGILPRVTLKKLPNIGYLEQTVGNILTKACCAVNVLRPKYPGLSVELSGALFIGLYLKVYNPVTDKAQKLCYKKALRIYEARSKLIIKVGLRMRSMDNPFASYPKCCHGKELETSDSTVKKPSSTKFLPSNCQVAIDLNYRQKMDEDDYDYFDAEDDEDDDY